jgi:hypothetical protein
VFLKIAAATAEYYNFSTASDCYCLYYILATTGHYPWILWASMLVAIQGPYLYIVKRLLAVKDVLAMGAEVARSLIAFDVFAGAYFILLALVDTGYMQFDTRIHVLLIVMLAWILLDVNVISRRKWVANADRHSPSKQRKHRSNTT